MNKKKSEVIQYVITAIVTMTIVFSIALISEISLLWKCEQDLVKVELAKKIFSEFYTIEELEKHIAKNKNDYKAHIKLAQKYNNINEYNTANLYFQTALKLSERSNLALYSYAMFCAERKLYNHALNMAEEISLFNKKAMFYKAKIYEKIAQNLDKDGQIEASTKAYQVAFKYATSAFKKEDLETLRISYATEYIRLADLKIEKKDTASAILDIQNSLNIKETPLAKYKLALIYKDIDTQKSEKIMASVFDENPYIINPYIYNDILKNLIEEARLLGSTTKINYYTNKTNRFKKLMSKIYIFKGDIKITNIDIFPQKRKFFKKEDIVLVVDIRNNTSKEIENLYMLIEIYYGNKKVNIEKRVASKTNILEEQGARLNYEIKLPPEITKDDMILANDLIIKFYAKKQRRAPWSLIKIQQLK